MALVSSVDYAARRIYLSAATAASGFELDTLDVYREVLALRKSTAAHRKYLPIISAAGNEPKITNSARNSYSPISVKLLRGCRPVPYNGSHTIRLVRDTYTDDGLADADCFDLSPLSVGVEINIVVAYDPNEIREIATGSGPTAAQIAAATRADLAAELALITNLAKLHALGATLTVTPTSRTAGNLVQTISTVGDATVIS